MASGQTLTYRDVGEWAALRKDAAPGGACVVAVSGGADSVALLHATGAFAREETAGLRLIAAYVAHGERSAAEEAADWETVQKLGRCLNCAAVRTRIEWNSGDRRSEHAMSRRRRELLQEVVRNTGARILLLGHHEDDLIESFAMHALRGTSLQSMKYRYCEEADGLRVVRPFWKTPRIVIRQYATQHGLRWVEDRTNQDLRRQRNFVRHIILPMAEREEGGTFGVAVSAHIRTVERRAAEVRVAAAALLDTARTQDGALRIETFRGRDQDVIHAALAMWLAGHGAAGQWGERKLKALTTLLKSSGGEPRLDLGAGWVAIRTDEQLHLTRCLGDWEAREIEAWRAEHLGALLMRDHDEPAQKLHWGVLVKLPAAVRQQREILLLNAEAPPPPGFAHHQTFTVPATVCLYLRPWVPGDRISANTRLKKEWLERRVPRAVRSRLLVVADDEGRVFAVASVPQFTHRHALPNGARLARLSWRHVEAKPA